MFLVVYDKLLNKVGIIDNFTSLVWNRKYNKCGTFELHLQLNNTNLELLKIGNTIYKSGDSESGYIDYRNLVQDSLGNETLIVKGNFSSGILNQRINWGKLNIIGKSEHDVILDIITENCISPSDPKRVINNLLVDNKYIGSTMDYQNSYGSVLTEIEKITQSKEIGFKTNFDTKNKKYIVELYKGENRTVNQANNPKVIFSQEFENLIEANYIDSINNYCNVTLVMGAGEGIKRRNFTIADGSSGIDRFELFTDARDISDMKTITVQVPDYDNTGKITGYHDEQKEVQMSDAEYLPLLSQRGNEKLAETKKINTFDSKISTVGNQKYKIDFDLGDLVTVISNRWGLKLDVRITEIQEVYDLNGFNIYPTFGNGIPTIFDKIKHKIM